MSGPRPKGKVRRIRYAARITPALCIDGREYRRRQMGRRKAARRRR